MPLNTLLTFGCFTKTCCFVHSLARGTDYTSKTQWHAKANKAMRLVTFSIKKLMRSEVLLRRHRQQKKSR